MISSATEGCSTGVYHSLGSRVNPSRGGKSKRSYNSLPFIKPDLKMRKQIVWKILKHQQFKEPQKHQQLDFSLDDSRCFHKTLAAELDKIVQLKDKTIESGVNTGEIKEEDGRTLILEWADEIQSLQQKNKQNLMKESMFRSWFKTEQKFKKAGDMHVPDQVWRWIMKSSDKVALDPNTANPTLILSQDERSVRTRTYGESNPWSAHQRIHRQYDGWPCIQAKEGYLTGRHYWEVDVKGKCDWRIGVVKELAPRNGFVNMNTTSGYWTLCLQLGCLMALTNPVTKLDQANPSKIGVYLDVEEGQLSFYNTKKRKHIYTFKADFSTSRKIYPVFGTVETDKSLKIM